MPPRASLILSLPLDQSQQTDDKLWWRIIMTVFFMALLVKGFNATEFGSSVSGMYSGSTSQGVTVASPVPAGGSNSIYLWIPLIIVLIFAIIITILIVVGRQTHRSGCKCLRHPSSTLEPGTEPIPVALPRRNLTLNMNIAANSTDPIVPETPPPSYAVIARQISTISTISQTSSQIEIPPAYDEALGIPDRMKKRGSQTLIHRASSSSQSQISQSHPRIRLFTRSVSATESYRRTPVPDDNRVMNLAANETITEHPGLAHTDVLPGTSSLSVIHETSIAIENGPLNDNTQSHDHRFYIDEMDDNSFSVS